MGTNDSHTGTISFVTVSEWLQERGWKGGKMSAPNIRDELSCVFTNRRYGVSGCLTVTSVRKDGDSNYGEVAASEFNRIKEHVNACEQRYRRAGR